MGFSYMLFSPLPYLGDNAERGCAPSFSAMYSHANMGHPSMDEGFVLWSHRSTRK